MELHARAPSKSMLNESKTDFATLSVQPTDAQQISNELN